MFKKFTIIGCVFISLLSIIPGIARAGFFTKNKSFVRIAVLKDVDNFVISIRGKYKIVDAKGILLNEGRRLRKSRVIFDGKGVFIGRNFYSFSYIQIVVQKDASLYSGRRVKRYRGTLNIYGIKNKLLVVNVLPLEAYTRGVLYHEVPHKWPLEVIKAQAVATRTYALYQTEVNKARKYDVTSDIYSQVYGGRSAERYRTNIAADRTRGEVLFYKGKVLPAYFHSTCAGHTEDASELWNHDLAPLKGVVCHYCQKSSYYSWKKNFQSKEVQEKLNQNGYKIGLIKEIKVTERNKSGRIRTLKIMTRDGKTTSISGKNFRNIIGPNNLKSNKYDIVMKGYYFDVIGQGWGHGVGMCQWGAHQMAKERFNYKEILKYYYPGIKFHKY